MLSLILVASVTFPHITSRQIVMIMAGFIGAAVVAAAAILTRRREPRQGAGQPAAETGQPALTASVSRENWRMPALAMLAPAPMSRARRLGMTGMWVYLAIAMGAVVVRIVELALGH
jgi:hypothetical protein